MAQKLIQSAKSSSVLLFIVLSILTVLTACQGAEETAVPLPTETKIAGTPIQALIQTQVPQITETPALEGSTTESEQGETLASVTPLPPSPTMPPEPTATATPPPEPTFYTVQPGDTLVGISEQFSISLRFVGLCQRVYQRRGILIWRLVMNSRSLSVWPIE